MATFTRSRFSFLALLAVHISVQICAVNAWSLEAQEERGNLSFTPAEFGTYAFSGVVGNASSRMWTTGCCLRRWQSRHARNVRVRDRLPKPALVPWAGEFVGKYRFRPSRRLRMSDHLSLEAFVSRVIADVISTQAEDGYLGPFTKEERLLGNWDLWGHYHVMLALLMWYERTGDQAALDAVVRAANLICNTYLDGPRRPKDAGSTEMNLSVIHVFGRLYRHTGDPRYLRLMKTVVEDWEAPDAGDYYRQGLAGTPFYKTPKPRWESLHSIQGLVELYRITGDVSYKTAFENLWHGIYDYDLHNSGAFSTNEQAVGSPFRTGAVETCCTVAWMYMTVDMLALTGDATVADCLERGFWNAALGWQHPSGRWSTYNTPSNGVREASAHTIVFQSRNGTPELNCCSVNAPRALGMLSEWAVMHEGTDGVVINFYGSMDVTIPLSKGRLVRLSQETAYPRDGHVHLTVGLDAPQALKLSLRMPGWSKDTHVRVNGTEVEGVVAGTYLPLERTWKDGDTVDLQFDMSLRTWVGDEERAEMVSLYYGPLLLAFDQKRNNADTVAIPPLDITRLEFTPVPPKEEPFPPIVAFEFAGANGEKMALSDFATAGAYGTHYASWLPAVNLPPPAFRLVSPEDGARLPAGPARFEWRGPTHAENKTYTLTISEDASMDTPLRCWIIWTGPGLSDKMLEAGRTYYWDVDAKNTAGAVTAKNGPRSFVVDAALENPFAANPR